MHPYHFVVPRPLSLLVVSIAVTLLGAFTLSPHWGSVAAQGPEPQAPQVALGTGFTYQGQLKKNNAPVNDNNCSMTFNLWDSQSSGTGQVGGSQFINPVAVANGLFTVVLNGSNQFSASPFNGQDRWLQTAVQCTGDGSAVTLSRQPLTASPYALFAAAPWVTSGNNLNYTAGNVGIGTSSPTRARLETAGATGNTVALFGADGTGVSLVRDYPFIGFNTYYNGGWKAIALGYGGHIGVEEDSGAMTFYVNGSASTNAAVSPIEAMRIAQDGKVGIGTTSPSNKLSVNGGADFSGNVGIGTTNPTERLLVRGPDTSASTTAFRVNNSNSDFGLVVYDDRTVQIGALFGSAMTHACLSAFLEFAGCMSAAEYVPTIDSGVGFPETADLVSIAPSVKNPYDDEHSPFVVTKSAKPCDDQLLGFIVNPESGADGKKLNEHYLPLAIYGYFPAKVTIENGAIHRGDALTSSFKPGYAMKATRACTIIGYALEDATAEGTIQVFAQHGENAALEVATLRAQVQAQAEQLSAQQQQIDALVTRLTALEQSVRSNAVPSLASH